MMKGNVNSGRLKFEILNKNAIGNLNCSLEIPNKWSCYTLNTFNVKFLSKLWNLRVDPPVRYLMSSTTAFMVYTVM